MAQTTRDCLRFRSRETHGKQHEVGWPFPHGIGNFAHFSVSLTVGDKFNIDGCQFDEFTPGTDKLFA
jgi:hypothetical protein